MQTKNKIDRIILALICNFYYFQRRFGFKNDDHVYKAYSLFCFLLTIVGLSPLIAVLTYLRTSEYTDAIVFFIYFFCSIYSLSHLLKKRYLKSGWLKELTQRNCYNSIKYHIYAILACILPPLAILGTSFTIYFFRYGFNN